MDGYRYVSNKDFSRRIPISIYSESNNDTFRFSIRSSRKVIIFVGCLANSLFNQITFFLLFQGGRSVFLFRLVNRAYAFRGLDRHVFRQDHLCVRNSNQFIFRLKVIMTCKRAKLFFGFFRYFGRECAVLFGDSFDTVLYGKGYYNRRRARGGRGASSLYLLICCGFVGL